MNRLNTEKRAQILRCLVEGNSIRSTVRITGAAKNTVVKLLIDAGKACSEYQDEVFGGSEQPRLIITFTPGDDLVQDGDYAVIVDVDGDGDFNDEPESSYIATDTAKANDAVSVEWNINNKLQSLNDDDYDIAVIIDNLDDGEINWGDEEKVKTVDDSEAGNPIRTDLDAGNVDELRSEFSFTPSPKSTHD